MEPGARVYHYIKPNETTRLPRRHIVLDVGARTERTKHGHDRTWRCAVAWFLTAPKGRKPKEHEKSYVDVRTLWTDVDAHCGKGSRTVLWAHSLGYQARIAEALTILPAMGWEIQAHNLAPRGCWMVWRRGEATLTMVDIAAVWPTSLKEIGKLFGLAQPKMADNQTSDEAWLTFCTANVGILRKAVTSYLEWIETADLGNWQLTGAGQSYAIFRHKFMSHNLLVHADAEALDAERRAMWTGRCEAYWHGQILRQVIHEWDLSTAYARVARDVSVPTRLIGPMPPRYDWKSLLDNPRYALLAEVTVETDIPTVPTLHDGHILWPVGKFRTTLWDVEIAEAMADGAVVTVHKGWMYHSEPALREWAQWIIDGLAAPDDVVPAWQKHIMRHHGRALIGRWAMRYPTQEKWATAPHAGAERRTMIDNVDGTVYDITHIGTQVWRETGIADSPNSIPAITGYVMAAARVRLWRIQKALPKGAILYVDTDSVLATDLWAKQINALAESELGHGLRLKKSWTGFTIHGPRQIVTGERVRMAGVPLRATRKGRHEFEGEVYESVDVALRAGRPGLVRAVDRSWRPTGKDRRRRGPSVGWTEPHRLPVGAT